MSDQTTEFEHLVVDSGAIIRGFSNNFFGLGKNIWTVQGVLDEIRDSKSRALLESLPFEIKVKTPSAVDFSSEVIEFCRKSGDYPALSRTDIEVIALTYSLERELDGLTYIRKEPVSQLKERNFSSSQSSSSTGIVIEVQKHRDMRTPNEKPLVRSKDCAVEPGPENSFEGNYDHTLSQYSKDSSVSPTIMSTEDFTDTADSITKEISLTDGDSDSNDVDDEGEDGLQEYSDDGEPETDSELQDPPIGEDETAVPSLARPTDFPEQGKAGDQIPKESAVFSYEESNFPSLCPHVLQTPSPPNPEGEVFSRPAKSWANIASTNSSVGVTKTHALPRRILAQPLQSKSSDIASTVSAVEPHTVDRDPVAFAPSAPLSSRILSNHSSQTLQGNRQMDEDDGQDWINPSNINQYRNAGNSTFQTTSVKYMKRHHKVACITTDFTIQNVLLQMNLGLASVNGLAIRSIRQWINRCGACYKIHYEMERLFCSKCGSSMIQRIAASIDSKTGELKLHLKKNYQVNTRGQIYPLPKPGQQGRFDGEILLREDQLKTGIWKQKVVKIQKNVSSAFGDDIAGDLGLHINKTSDIRIGLGKQNPNANKGRERRGKKK